MVVTVASPELSSEEVIPAGIRLTNIELNDTSEYIVEIRGITNDSYFETLTITDPTFGADYIELPNLGIGTYNIEIQEINSDGKSNFISATFLWHTKIKNLETAVGSVCVDSPATFWVNNTSLNTNYKASYIKFNFGDGSDEVFYTLSHLLINNITPDEEKHEINHTYDLVSCGNNGDSFITTINLLPNIWTALLLQVVQIICKMVSLKQLQ